MKLYNTLTRKIEKFTPIAPPRVSFYACGPTVYDYAHLGHLRRYTMDDFLLRTLRHAGYEVEFVQNVTDVGHLASDADTGEDKMEKGAKKYQTTVWDLAKKFEDHFYGSMKKMGNLRPDNVCRVTEVIDQQIEMVQELESKGFTYVIEGDGVYFDTSQLDDYGKLARLDIKNLQEGARVEKVVGKRNPTDFALWKFERPGENRSMVWKSPWAERGFPGWHIECSAISRDQLGDQIDLHSGGVDHIPVHHTNEIAQSEAVTGKSPFVKYWVHHNFLQIDGQKMSKSLGNLFTIEDVEDRGFHPLALRLLFLTAHYRSEMNFTWENLAGAQKSYHKLVNFVSKALAAQDDSQLSQKQKAAVKDYHQRFFELLEDDLKTSEAVAVMWEVVKVDLPAAAKLELLLEFDQILGLSLDRVEEINKELDAVDLETAELSVEVSALLEKRRVAREQKDFALADKLRDQLQIQGFVVEDTDAGQKLKKLS
jgi:cysteinyl-tRNA synthetase